VSDKHLINKDDAEERMNGVREDKESNLWYHACERRSTEGRCAYDCFNPHCIAINGLVEDAYSECVQLTKDSFGSM
jgi:hypothetical protein